MKNDRFKPKAGLNFKKMVRRLSNNALKYLISISNQEASYRNLKITIPNLGEDLPVITLQDNQTVYIRDEKWIVNSYTLGDGEWKLLSDTILIDIDTETSNWFELYKDKTPISVKLVAESSNEEKIIEFHSRSKIFWFNKLLHDDVETSIISDDYSISDDEFDFDMNS